VKTPALTFEGGVPSGLTAVGAVPWGSHLCYFYRTAEELRRGLLPFFGSGLSDDEQCLWITSDIVPAGEARESLAAAVPDLVERQHAGQIEIIDYAEWQEQLAGNDGEAVVADWIDRATRARSMGFSGLRISGNAFWLETEDGRTSTDYGAAVRKGFRDHRIVALSTYSLNRCMIDDILAALRNHEFALLQRNGSCEVVRSATQLVAAVSRLELGAGRSDHAVELFSEGSVSASAIAKLLSADLDGSTLTRHRELEQERDRLLRAERDINNRLACLQRVTATLTEATALDELAAMAGRVIPSALGADRVLIYVADSAGSDLRLLAAKGAHTTGGPDDASPALSDAFCVGAPAWIGNRREMAAPYGEAWQEEGAVACLPLCFHGRRLGAMSIHFSKPQAFQALQRALIQDIAEQTAFAADRARLHEETESQKQRLEAAGRAKDQFMGMLGHELRGPLAAIRTAAELLKTDDSRKVRLQAGDVVERQTAHMARLLDDLLNVTRITQGKITLRKEPVSFTDVLRKALADRQEEIRQRGITLRSDIAKKPLWVMADPDRLLQIIDNLLSNAVKFTPSAGTVTVSCREENLNVVLSVGDTGEGIEPALMKHVFEPFWQAPQEISRSAGGLGLGLPLAKQLVELHDGTVTAKSDGEHRGSEFTVRLPRSRERAARRRLPRRTSTPKRILIVDDDRCAADLLCKLLKLKGHETSVIYSGMTAVATASAFLPDVILCDIGLPDGVDGYDVAKAIRREPSLSDALLIALSGYGRPEDVRRSEAAGFDAHLTKPVSQDAIQAILTERRRAPRRLPSEDKSRGRTDSRA
jgi:signal transduction histidine kinase/ActR/RegA family two-component response regulator